MILGENYASIENKSGVVMKNSGLATKVERIEGENTVNATFVLNGDIK